MYRLLKKLKLRGDKKVDAYIEKFVEYLMKERKLTANSLNAYSSDLIEFSRFIKNKEIESFLNVQNTEIISFLLHIKNQGKSGATANRKIASLRAFYNFMVHSGELTVNPTNNIKTPKIERKKIEYLTIQEIDSILSIPDKSLKGLRDKALLELLYATGIRVSEVVEANVIDINLRMGFITCTGEHGKARIIPLGRPARAAMEQYIFEVREKLIKDPEESALFVNYYGSRLTRQGLWKLMKEYTKLAEVETKITPQIFRNSFAVHMVQNGADLRSLQELLGHEDMSATQIYLTVTKNRIKDVYDSSHPRA